MNVRYRVELSQAERDELMTMLSGGKRAARKLKRAQILLAADAGRSDEEIARTVPVSGSTAYRTKRRFVEGNLERALSEELRPGAERKLTGKEEALLVATACANPPQGRARWTLKLLADAMVALTDHESCRARRCRLAVGARERRIAQDCQTRGEQNKRGLHHCHRHDPTQFATLTTCTRRFSAAVGLDGSFSCVLPYPTVTSLPSSILYFSIRNRFTASARRSDSP